MHNYGVSVYCPRTPQHEAKLLTVVFFRLLLYQLSYGPYMCSLSAFRLQMVCNPM